MKKYILAGAVVLAVALYAIRGRFTNTPSTQPNQTNTTTAGDVPTPTPVPGPTPNPTPTPVATQTAQYKDGQYTGSTEDAFYGLLQVKAVVTGGKLTDVQFLKYPNDRPESVQVNSASNPLLKSEAIQAQSANVDIVSGATQSSEAFQKSLATALAQAK